MEFTHAGKRGDEGRLGEGKPGVKDANDSCGADQRLFHVWAHNHLSDIDHATQYLDHLMLVGLPRADRGQGRIVPAWYHPAITATRKADPSSCRRRGWPNTGWEEEQHSKGIGDASMRPS